MLRCSRVFSMTPILLGKWCEGGDEIPTPPNIRAGSHKLTTPERDSLVQWIIDINRRKTGPRPSTDSKNIIFLVVKNRFEYIVDEIMFDPSPDRSSAPSVAPTTQCRNSIG